MGYVDLQQGAHARTAFRNAEKQYKRYKEASTRLRSSRSRNKIQPIDVSQVLDFNKYVDAIKERSTQIDGVTLAAECLPGKPVFVIEGRPGFHFIPQALNVDEQYYWIQESICSFPQPPNRTNHNVEYGSIRNLWSAVKDHSVLIEVGSEEEKLSSLEDPGNPKPVTAHTCANPRSSSTTARVTNEKAAESSKQWRFAAITSVDKNKKSVPAESLLRRLRWATIGMQFDWSKKAYNTTLPFERLPQKLSELAATLAVPAMSGSEFKAEAAIVNYYGPDDMLGGHVDDMEADWSKPIVSISLGCKAIFLLGGETRDEPPIAMFLRSGDVVLMSGPARSCFHGVPRIFIEDDNSDVPDFSTLEKDLAQPISRYIRESRININIRQVY